MNHLTAYGASGEGTRESEFGGELVLIIHAIETGVEEETRDEGISRTEGHQGEHGEETHIIVVEKPAALVSTFDHDAGYKREGTEGRVVAGKTQHGILPAFPLVLAALSKQDAVNDFLSSRFPSLACGRRGKKERILSRKFHLIWQGTRKWIHILVKTAGALDGCTILMILTHDPVAASGVPPSEPHSQHARPPLSVGPRCPLHLSQPSSDCRRQTEIILAERLGDRRQQR